MAKSASEIEREERIARIEREQYTQEAKARMERAEREREDRSIDPDAAAKREMVQEYCDTFGVPSNRYEQVREPVGVQYDPITGAQLPSTYHVQDKRNRRRVLPNTPGSGTEYDPFKV